MVRTLLQLKKAFGWEPNSPKEFIDLIDTLSTFPVVDDLHESVFMTTAEVLDGNTTPKVLLAAQGAAKFINLKKAHVALAYNSAAYATNLSLQLRLGTTVIAEVEVLDVTADTIKEFTLSDSPVIPLNSTLNVIVKTDDPITGDSPLGIFFDYSVDDDLVAQVPTA